MRGCNLSDRDVQGFCKVLETNRSLRVLDLSYNKLTPKSIEYLSDLLDHNKTIEFIGLAKNNLSIEHVKPLLDKIGRFEFPAESVDEHNKKIKERDTLIEKNKKVKPGAQKEVVPAVDDIEQNEETKEWTIKKNWNLRHVNLCMNPIGDEAREYIMGVMKRTGEEFSLTLSGTDFDENTIHEMSEELSTDDKPSLGQQRLIY
jgi:hypothetical protein